MYKWIWMIHDISINILWQVIIPYEESYQPAMGPRWVSTTFWLCRAVCGSDHGGNHRGVGETKEQTKCLSKLVKRLQVPKMRRIWCFCFTRNFGADEIDRIYIYIYIDMRFIFDEDILHGIQGVAVFVCLIYHPLSSDSNLSRVALPPSVGNLQAMDVMLPEVRLKRRSKVHGQTGAHNPS